MPAKKTPTPEEKAAFRAEFVAAVGDEVEPRLVRLLDLHARVSRIEGILQTHGMMAPLPAVPFETVDPSGGGDAS